MQRIAPGSRRIRVNLDKHLYNMELSPVGREGANWSVLCQFTN